MPKFSKSFLIIVAVILGFTMSQYCGSPPEVHSPWTVGGLSPGTSRQRAKASLGEAKVTRHPIDDDHVYNVFRWESPGVSLWFVDDRDDSRTVMGSQLEFAGVGILGKGDRENKVLRFLGTPDQRGQDFLTYERDYEITLWFSKDRLRTVELSRLASQREPLPKAISPY